MTTLLRITNGINRLPDAVLAQRAQSILNAMQGNLNFPTPDPNLSDLSTALVNFREAVDAAKNADRLLVAIKNAKKEVLVTLLHNLGNYVLFAAKGNAVVALSSGFHIAKTPAPLPPLTKPVNLQLSEGVNSGEMQAVVDKVKGAKAYIFEYTADPLTAESVWVRQSSTQRKAFIEGLTSGSRYWCRVAAIGINGQVVYSDAVSRIVQ